MVHRARTLRLVALYPIDRLPPDLTEMWRPVQNLEISYWDDCRQVLREPWGKFSALKTLRLYQCVLEHPGYNTFGPMTSLTDLEVVECKLSNSFMICGDNLVRIVLTLTRFPDILEKRRSSFRRMQCLEFHGDCKSVLPSLKVFNSLVNYFFDKVIPETALLDCIFSRDSRPVVVRWNDLIA
ncbi:hypothetical protein LINGRAHAP2_LOCUS3554 [Linum grandiflorum]